MKKIVNGLKYDTETATKVAEYEPFSNTTDFNWWCEELYRTSEGKWFKYGEGGPLSMYAKSGGKQTWGSSEIIPLAQDEAYEWLEKYNFVDKIEQYFPNNIEDA